jgi:hypothetical protein
LDVSSKKQLFPQRNKEYVVDKCRDRITCGGLLGDIQTGHQQYGPGQHAVFISCRLALQQPAQCKKKSDLDACHDECADPFREIDEREKDAGDRGGHECDCHYMQMVREIAQRQAVG